MKTTVYQGFSACRRGKCPHARRRDGVRTVHGMDGRRLPGLAELTPGDQRALVVASSHAGEPVPWFAIISPLTTHELLVDILDTLHWGPATP
jgi:hypothetical protein